MMKKNYNALAYKYHKILIDEKPFGIYEYLKIDRGLTDKIIKKFWIGCTKNNSITIPIYNKDFEIVDIKFRHFTGKSKYTHLKGGKPEIYGWEKLLKENKFIFAEGELDVLVLERYNIPAITVSGGAGTFNNEWIDYFKNKEIYFWFDNDAAGKRGVEKISSILASVAKRIYNISPKCLKEKEDVTDYFVKYRKTVDDLRQEIQNLSEINPIIKEPVKETEIQQLIKGNSLSQKELNILDSFEFIDKVVKVSSFGYPRMAICPFHKDNSPSFAIYDDGWYCFSCLAHGRGNIQFVMKLMGFKYEEAVNYLKNFLNFSFLKNNGLLNGKQNADTA